MFSRSDISIKPPCSRGAGRWRVFILAALVLAGGMDLTRAGGWYVGNTAATEWVRYRQVFFSAGAYRFTARAGSPVAGAAMHLEVDGVSLGSVAVPKTGRADAFGYVHLGHAAIKAGYHDLKVVFDSANISLDWFMLSKDPDVSGAVKVADYTMLPSDNADMIIAPVVAFGHKTSSTGLGSALSNYVDGANHVPCPDEAVQAWYGIPMYRDFDRRTDRYWDTMVDELMASKAQVPLLHCRETKDLTSNLQDRSYQEGPGNFEGRWLLKFAEAVQRNPQAASSLKIGMFWENGAIADQFKTRYGRIPSWGDPALVDYVMTYHLIPWFDSVPASMLYEAPASVAPRNPNGYRRPIITFFANHPDHIVNDGKMADFISAVCMRLEERYGYDPLIILPSGGDVDNAVEALGWGQATWGVWDGPCLTPNIFRGTAWGITCDGARRRIDTVWNNDWNPATNKGTPGGSNPGHDSFQDRCDFPGHSRLLTTFAQARKQGMRLVLEEGFTNLAEGNSIYRSYHPGWSFPNQHIAAMREYADPNTRTALFEAEGCDDYHKVVNDGNSGGSFRAEWYKSGNNLDVYRPLHNLQDWVARSPGSGKLAQIAAGFYDVWAVDTEGKVWAQPIAGAGDTWIKVSNGNLPKMASISLSKERAWGVGTSGEIFSTGIPYGWPNAGGTTAWTLRSNSPAVTQLSVGISEVWGVNAGGEVYRRPADGTGDWQLLSGGTMDQVWMGDSFVWGMKGANLFYVRTPAPGVTSVAWTQVLNSEKIATIAVGSEEVWGVGGDGRVFRRSISGVGGWDQVPAGSVGIPGPRGKLSSLAIGENYVWGLVGTVPYRLRLEGFSGAAVLPPLIDTVTPGDVQVTLAWTAVSGATGYNLKRATTKGGPYTTIRTNFMPVFQTDVSYTDPSLQNGTTYSYVISALTPTETANSREVSAAPQSKVPEPPTGLRAVLGFDNAVVIEWGGTPDRAAGFKIERKTGTGDFGPIAAVPAGTTRYVDATAVSGPDYTYRVCGYNPAGNSAYTGEVAVSTADHRLSRAGWVATSSGGESPAKALDDDPASRWTSGKPQAGKEWFQVDMKGLRLLYQIDLRTQGGDFPRSYELSLSPDGVNWGKPVTAGAGVRNVTTAAFDPQRARYVRIRQIGTATNSWSISEFTAYGHPAEAMSPAGWAFTASISTATARNAGDGNLGTGWTSGPSPAPGQWFKVDMRTPRAINHLVLNQGAAANDYPAGYEVYVSVDGLKWGKPVAKGVGTPGMTIISFAPQTARHIGVIRTGAAGTSWSIGELQVYGPAK